MGIREMALGAVMNFWLIAKNIAEAWMAWSLNAARNWAMSRPVNVRERNEEAGSNADMRAFQRKGRGGPGRKAYCIVSPTLAKALTWATRFPVGALDMDCFPLQTGNIGGR